MPDTAIVWFRRDLRVHDHPALTAAARGAERVVPVFVLDDALLHGRFESGPRGRFLLGCLRELREALRERGADLVVRAGDPARELAALARRDRRDAAALRLRRVAASRWRATAASARRWTRRAWRSCAIPGLFVADVGKPRTQGRQAVRGLLAVLARVGAARAARGPRRAARARAARRRARAARSRRPTRSGCPTTCRTRSRRARPPGRERMHAWLRDGIARLREAATTGSRAAPRSSRRTCTSAASRRASSSSAPATPARARARRSSCASCAGATSTRTCCSPTPATRATPTGARWTSSSGRTTTRRSRPGARAGPASRSSTPACASCASAAGSTTARG